MEFVHRVPTHTHCWLRVEKDFDTSLAALLRLLDQHRRRGLSWRDGREVLARPTLDLVWVHISDDRYHCIPGSVVATIVVFHLLSGLVAHIAWPTDHGHSVRMRPKRGREVRFVQQPSGISVHSR